ncbi:MAG: peptidase M49 [Planctomycetes bacterium]|nr:peptidase M49 [Planctomycetota bacterium]
MRNAGAVWIGLAVAALTSCSETGGTKNASQGETKGEPVRRVFLEQVGDVAVAQLYADGFESLPLDQKLLAYHLTQAAIAGDAITYDQHSRFALDIRDIIEGILSYPDGLDRGTYDRVRRYAILFWAHHGNHNTRTMAKFLPEFSYEEVLSAMQQAMVNGSTFGVATPEAARKKLDRVRPALFDPKFEPLVTNKTPGEGGDILTASANNFYEGVTTADLQGFTEKNPLNSRLVKGDSGLTEEVYRAGGDGAAPGLYADELSAVIGHLEAAIPFAGPKQAEALRQLVRYFRTGDPAAWRDYNIAWVGDNPAVDAINGFVEVYHDPRGQKGSYESAVFAVDRATTELMRKLAGEAQYFEDRMPWKDEYKNKKPAPPIANAVTILCESGDAGPISWAGINLPNEQEIRQNHGSKSILLWNVMGAADTVNASRLRDEFIASDAERNADALYGSTASNLKVALHEVIGHGSGKVSEKLEGDPSKALREYYSTMEEARADLCALWMLPDPKLHELGLVGDPKVVEVAYAAYVRSAITQLRQVPAGSVLEEDHMRGTNMIVNWLREKSNCIAASNVNGRTFYRVTSVEKMRQGVGQILSELMRCKAEGDYAALKALVDGYGTKLDPKLRDEVVSRAQQAKIPATIAYVMPDLKLVTDKSGKPTDVTVSYPQSMEKQKLAWSRRAARP